MKMLHKHLNENLNYDGTPIEPAWALKEYSIKGSSIITWIGPMLIKKDKIIDYEDVDLEIKSDVMAHFIVEHFDCQPADLRMAYHRQRILVMILKDELSNWNIPCTRKGDDLYINSAKLSVSIATVTPSSMKVHLGINVKNQGTPHDVETSSLMDNNQDMDMKSVIKLMEDTSKRYINEIYSIEEDIAKTRIF
ncbi:DUF366 family protein [Methanobacterium movens]